MEEKKTKKTKKSVSDPDEFALPVESFPELSGESDIEKRKSVEKIAHTVIFVRPHIVIYKSLDGNNAFTKNIWGMNLKPGELIYL
jgi:hypothetical protein